MDLKTAKKSVIFMGLWFLGACAVTDGDWPNLSMPLPQEKDRIRAIIAVSTPVFTETDPQSALQDKAQGDGENASDDTLEDFIKNPVKLQNRLTDFMQEFAEAKIAYQNKLDLLTKTAAKEADFAALNAENKENYRDLWRGAQLLLTRLSQLEENLPTSLLPLGVMQEHYPDIAPFFEQAEEQKAALAFYRAEAQNTLDHIAY